MGTLKTIFAKSEPVGSEGWQVVLRKLVNAVAPGAQTFQSGTERGMERRLMEREKTWGEIFSRRNSISW